MNTYFISSGFGNGMFTLRERYLVNTGFALEEKDEYVKNLSRDYDKAVAKAKEWVSDKGKLEVGKVWDLTKWGEAEKDWRYTAPELSAEEIAKREADAKAEEIKKAKEEAEYQEVLRQRQEAYDKAEPVPVTDERIQFTGVIEKTYHKDNQWGGQWRMFFVDDRGFKLNGALIKAPYIIQRTGKQEIINEGTEDEFKRTLDCSEGDRVSFVAKVTPSDDDPKFGFFKRPTQVIKEENNESN